MSDIVERLNQFSETPHEGDPMVDCLLGLCAEAATEIATLRAKLAEMEGAHRAEIAAMSEQFRAVNVDRFADLVDQAVAAKTAELEAALAASQAAHKAAVDALPTIEKIDGAIRCLQLLKADFKMAGANATTMERAIDMLREFRRARTIVEGGK